jgi:hypothetical protein
MPHEVYEPILANRQARLEGKHRQQQALPRRAKPQRRTIRDNLNGTKQSKLQSPAERATRCCRGNSELLVRDQWCSDPLV